MSQIMKAYTGVFLILLMTAVSLGILSAYVQVLDAQDMKARFIHEAENSSFDTQVMQACFEESRTGGCSLEVTLFTEDGKVIVWTDENGIGTLPDNVQMARIELTFPFRIPFLGINSMHTFSGYAVT